MKSRSSRVILYIITIFISILIGSIGMWAVAYFFPIEVGSVTNITKLDKEVTVTDAGIADAVDKIIDAVVVVNTYSKNSHVSSGTGFVYKVEGKIAYILTNHHVVESGDVIKVVFTDGSEKTTKVVSSDQYADIAVLSLEADEILSVAPIGKSIETRVGDTVFAVGAPLNSIYSWTVTRGIVSGKDRLVEVSVTGSGSSDWIMKVLQTDAAINSGNSGGPLANSNGEVIGINSLKLVSSGVEGMGFAIPIEDAIEYAEQLISGNGISRPYLGISMIDISDTRSLRQTQIDIDSSITSGVVLTSIEKGSPAEIAGLKSGDVITKLNDVKITSVAMLRYELFKHEIGDKITISYVRGTSEKTTTVTLKTAS